MDSHREKQEQMHKLNRREFFVEVAKVTGAVGLAGTLPTQVLEQTGDLVAPESAAAFSCLSSELIAGWLNPAHTYRPHTRWWWPGNAVTRDGLAWELEQMHQQGMAEPDLRQTAGRGQAAGVKQPRTPTISVFFGCVHVSTTSPAALSKSAYATKRDARHGAFTSGSLKTLPEIRDLHHGLISHKLLGQQTEF